MIFNEDKKNLIKVFEINRTTEVAYLISTLLHILNRWQHIRIYIYNIGDEKIIGVEEK